MKFKVDLSYVIDLVEDADLYPIDKILLSLLTMHAPTCVDGSLLLIADSFAIDIKYSSQLI